MYTEGLTAPEENMNERNNKYNPGLVVMNVSLVHPAPKENMIELYDKNTLVSFLKYNYQCI